MSEIMSCPLFPGAVAGELVVGPSSQATALKGCQDLSWVLEDRGFDGGLCTVRTRPVLASRFADTGRVWTALVDVTRNGAMRA
jgi:hypothetical protein